MFNRKQPVFNDIDQAIADAHAFLAGTGDGTDEYEKQVDQLAKLYKMKETLPSPNRVSKDAMVAAIASVGSVALILIFEGVGRGIITSKSVGFVPKPKNKTN
jgi:hypothetical protein